VDLGQWEKQGPVMSFGDHLEDLRKRLVWALVGIVPLFVAGLVLGGPLLGIIVEPLTTALADAGQPTRLLATSPLETFVAYIKVALALTLTVGAPWIILQLWLFVSPGLYASERRFVFFLVPLSGVLSALGVLFLYYILLPISLFFLIMFGTRLVQTDTPGIDEPPPAVGTVALPQMPGDPSPRAIEGGLVETGDVWVNTRLNELRVLLEDGTIAGTPLSMGSAAIAQSYRVGEYVNLVFVLGLVFVIAFQLPMVLMLLSWVGIFEARDLTPYRRQIMFGCGVAGAVLTPQDPFSMLLLGVALYGLFEFGLVLMRFVPARVVAEGFGRGKTDADEGDA
jgi:sec-independent protein translocase protein TatC